MHSVDEEGYPDIAGQFSRALSHPSHFKSLHRVVLVASHTKTQAENALKQIQHACTLNKVSIIEKGNSED